MEEIQTDIRTLTTRVKKILFDDRLNKTARTDLEKLFKAFISSTSDEPIKTSEAKKVLIQELVVIEQTKSELKSKIDNLLKKVQILLNKFEQNEKLKKNHYNLYNSLKTIKAKLISRKVEIKEDDLKRYEDSIKMIEELI